MKRLNYPKTSREKTIYELHGEKIQDPYQWLEDLSDPKVRAWLDKQHEFTEQILKQIPNREKNQERIQELLDLGAIFCPTMKGDHLFFQKRKRNENQPVLYVQMKDQEDPKEVVNPNKLSEKGLVALDWFYPSPQGNFLAYGLSKDGDEWSILHVLNVATGESFEEKIPRTRYCSLAWLKDESGFYYTRFPEAGTVPPGQENYNRHIFFHELGTDWHNDPKIFGEGRPPTDIPIISLSEDNRYLLITIHKYVKSDLYIMDLEKDKKITTVVEDEDFLSSGAIINNQLWIISNYQAPNKAIYKTSIDNPKPNDWEIIIPESKKIIEEIIITDDHLFVNSIENAVNKIDIFSTNGDFLQEMTLPPLGNISLNKSKAIRYCDQPEFYFSFRSFFHPKIVYRYRPSQNKLEKFDEISSPINPENFDAKQVWYNSKDGTKVSMFVVHPKDLKLDGTTPTLLTGYGGFNIPVKPPYLKNSRFFWLEKGGIIAIPNLRGGSEYGEKWHKNGMLVNKQNVFDDFISAAKWLIENNYTSPEHLGISGRSNGGLLVGAAVTQEPELFAAVYCAVPLLDMIRYHHFSIAKLWVPEYGSSEDPEQFKFLYNYSPYHNIEKGKNYPATFFVAAESDSRVDPNHAMKMTAKMQWANASKEPIFLYVEQKAGHGVGKPIDKLVQSEMDLYTFLGWKTGLSM